MFRAPSEHSTIRLVCMTCNYSIDVPVHHGKPMQWVLEGKFRKREYLVCSICGFKADLPLHCGRAMLYSISRYRDVRDRLHDI
ncbi:MAG: hypothetical protein QW572_05060 [Candidatus Nitrosocaldus sp.]